MPRSISVILVLLIFCQYLKPQDHPQDSNPDLGSYWYDQYIGILVSGKIEKGSIVYFTQSMIRENDANIIVSVSYYISENEQRGFEISLPKSFLIIDSDSAKISENLLLINQSFKQQIHLLEMGSEAQQIDADETR